jgi:outer membrane PBP1 activator LpoA protein
MKKISLASLIAGALIFSACNGNSNKTTTSDSTTTTMSSADTGMNHMSAADTMNHQDTTNHSNAVATVGSDEQDFAKDAAAGGMMEVELGKNRPKEFIYQSCSGFWKDDGG